MNTIKVEVARLKEVVQRNREKHVNEYNEALKGYHESLKKALTEEYTQAVEYKSREVNPKFLYEFTKPISYVQEYDDFLVQLEWTTETTVDLTPAEVNQYIQDNWGWKEIFNNSTLRYKK
jgi:hypothetical protein